jgi:hypothetical protein
MEINLLVDCDGVWGLKVWREEFGRAEGRTADPSTALRSGRDDKGWGCSSIRILIRGMVNSRSLGYGRMTVLLPLLQRENGRAGCLG